MTQFKEVLRDVCKDAHKVARGEIRWHSAVVRFLDAWLAADDKEWNKIETVGRSREQTFRDLIMTACLAVGMHDPKHGFIASPLALERDRKDIKEQKRLAECAEVLAKHYRDGGHSLDKAQILAKYCGDARHPFYRTELNMWLQERAKFYEEEAAKFRERAAAAAAWSPRQKRSGLREDAWARRKFVRELASQIDRKFGERYSRRAVAAITDIAFPPADGRMTTAKEVDGICGPRGPRTR
jgi:hypothetical protein